MKGDRGAGDSADVAAGGGVHYAAGHGGRRRALRLCRRSKRKCQGERQQRRKRHAN